MKSKLFQLAKNDYVHAAYEAAVGAIVGYAYPILRGQGTFSLQSAKLALIGAIIMGARKAIELYLTNSVGQFAKVEPTPPPAQ